MLQLLLNISFVLPFILVILWIKPISREYLTNRVFSGMENPLYDFIWFSYFEFGNTKFVIYF